MAELVTLVVLLAAMVVAVPVAKRFGFGAPLGYLAAGLVVGPAGLGLVSGAGAIGHASELGVVMLLFLIGLELRPARLWVMRKSVLGLGGAQVLATGALVAALCRWGLGLPLPGAVVLGFGLALSSTAMALPMMAERGLLANQSGRNAFSVLLFQDLAIIPAVALLPLLGNGSMPQADNAWLAVAKAAVAVVAVLIGGRYLLRPIFRTVDRAGAPEIFTATALLIVIGTAVLIEEAGLSMSLGAFMAGVLLSDSEYRHEVQADIEPFEGLLLGLFFVTVGMGADIPALLAHPVRFFGLAAGLLMAKALVMLLLARVAGVPWAGAVRMATVLSQGGEFGFVLFGLAADGGAMGREQAASAMLVVTLSMLATPLLFAAEERWIAPRLLSNRPKRPFDPLPDDHPPVIICGFGRVGQVVGRVLRVRGIPFTALEQNAAQVDFVRKFGSKVYYGDPTRVELLRAAGAEKAKVLVVALDDMEQSLKVVELAKRHFPDVTIFARARNRRHAHFLMDRGVTHIVRETFDSSLRLTADVLRNMGLAEADVVRTLDTFRAHDERTLIRQHAVHQDESQLIQTSRQAAEELQALFEADRETGPAGADGANGAGANGAGNNGSGAGGARASG
ncbi:monovalent cation:proton antiporter-2 (CPA2) family protein [Azospirillum picis]|uniref:Monovalent cation:proton antiporter-2 (CPA2) family protein n=1 Tax=Azospirillum picis TaxID=488438 RepID=A0ABU0MH97_9PROT|nr:monovalent cation:proton antiporter-2 (CPA2) family protein [Azospirillum picis]MBP2298945.1 monovalent cation:proton antiporter-2 (CPA2) family protein [Azospirillum picis]MDQ0532813.1 monovalent cation:proton antiporter-2 (CPA2) family protein [Azospirillum picis]